MDKPDKGRPWISVYFSCCRVYQRVYVSPTQKAFVGWCPRCARRVEVEIRPDGTDDRFFVAN